MSAHALLLSVCTFSMVPMSQFVKCSEKKDSWRRIGQSRVERCIDMESQVFIIPLAMFNFHLVTCGHDDTSHHVMSCLACSHRLATSNTIDQRIQHIDRECCGFRTTSMIVASYGGWKACDIPTHALADTIGGPFLTTHDVNLPIWVILMSTSTIPWYRTPTAWLPLSTLIYPNAAG